MKFSNLTGVLGSTKDPLLPSEETKSRVSEGKLENAMGIIRKISQIFVSNTPSSVSSHRDSDPIDRKHYFPPQDRIPADLTAYQSADSTGIFPNPHQLFDRDILEEQSVGISTADDAPLSFIPQADKGKGVECTPLNPLEDPLLNEQQKNQLQEYDRYVQQQIPGQHQPYRPPNLSTTQKS